MPCVRTLAEIDRPIDLVDVFRRAELDAAARRGGGGRRRRRALAPARDRLGRVAPDRRDAGLDYVEDLCTAVVHRYEIRDARTGRTALDASARTTP